MTNLLNLLLGYKMFTFKDEDVKKTANLLLKAGFSCEFKGNTVKMRFGKIKRFKEILGTRVEFCESDFLGVGGYLYKKRKSYGIITALIISVFLFFFTGDLVWDVRVEGSELENNSEIEAELKKSGLCVGAHWSKLDKSKIEVDVLKNSEYVSWLNINRRGTVAYVSVIDKIVHEPEPEKTGYANIVAERDGVVEEITVVKGIAAVKVGDSVKKGDILISGVIPTELGGGFCYAEGSVSASVSDSLVVEIPMKKEIKSEKKQRLFSVSLNIFGFSVKILKIYRNFANPYDIIKSERNVSHSNGAELPFSITREYAVPYIYESKRLTYSEAASEASQKMTDALAERLSISTLKRIKTDGNFSEDSYVLRSDFVCSEDIGQALPFEAH